LSASVLSSTWLVYPRPNPAARLRIFCFPYAGAGPVAFRNWPDALPPDVEVVSLLYPGRESRLREPRFVSLAPLLNALLAEVEPVLDRPFAFYGHSLGGLIAYGLACLIQARRNLHPVHLFISSRRAPHLSDPHLPLHNLGDAAFADAIQERYGGIPTVIRQDPELMALFLPILKADFLILETYQYSSEPPLECPITVYGGLQDPSVSQSELAAWQIHTTQTCAVRMFPGDHFFIQTERVALLQAVSESLSQSTSQLTRRMWPEGENLLPDNIRANH